MRSNRPLGGMVCPCWFGGKSVSQSVPFCWASTTRAASSGLRASVSETFACWLDAEMTPWTTLSTGTSGTTVVMKSGMRWPAPSPAFPARKSAIEPRISVTFVKTA